jgi:hypothetical protein
VRGGARIRVPCRLGPLVPILQPCMKEKENTAHACGKSVESGPGEPPPFCRRASGTVENPKP